MERGTTEEQPVGRAFRPLPLTAIRPLGWLRDQLQVQASGLTGHLGEIWPDVGPQSGWLGGDGESWERGPYYCDGLVPLAYLLDDAPLIALAGQWMDWTLNSQRDDGQFGPPGNEDWWARMPMLKALMQHHEATGDPRVPPFMARYFQYQRTLLPRRPLEGWGWARGAENLLAVHWLHDRTSDPALLELAELIDSQTLPWGDYLTEFPCRERVKDLDHHTHVVNVAMGIKAPAVRYVRTGDQEARSAVATALANLMAYHGQVQGLFSGDEWLAGTDPSQGTELCAVVELMYSLEVLLSAFGEARHGDLLEGLAFNALPATISADMCTHQYDQQANQVLCTVATRNWTQNGDDSNIFGLQPNFGCCTANMHQGWPKFTASLWMSRPGGGLAAVAYAPCTVTAQATDGTRITIREETDYPFEETVRFVVESAAPAQFGLTLRIPAWCADPRITVNGTPTSLPLVAGRFVTVQRRWQPGDTLQLTLPMAVRAIWRPRGATGIARGPLTFALRIGEQWTPLQGEGRFADHEVRPTTPWNYALALDRAAPHKSFRVETGRPGPVPFVQAAAPLRLHGHGYRLPAWSLEANSAAVPPISPVTPEGPAEEITLIPYGCARLRVAEFPVAAAESKPAP